MFTVMKIVIKSGASIKEHQKKEIHTMKQTTNSYANKRQLAVQYPEKDCFTVSNRQSSKIVTAYVWHKKHKSMNNVIEYVAPKNKTMAHIMSFNNRISYVVGISIFGFKTYWKQLFALMEIQTT